MRLSKGSDFRVVVFTGLALVIFSFPSILRAQTTSCPAGYQASQYSTDSSGNRHIVSCVDQKTGSYWFAGGTAEPGGSIQYVTTTGNDSNSGLSWGAAKATIGAAYHALPSCRAGGSSWKCGTIHLGGGTFTLSSPVTIASPYVSIRGQGGGLSATIIKYTGRTGCALNYTGYNATDGESYGGGLFDLSILGPGSVAGTCGLQTYDIIGFQMRSISIRNFLGSGSSCWWDHAVHADNERMKVSVELADCTTLWNISSDATASNYPEPTFGYGNFSVWMNLRGGETGLHARNAVLTYSNVHVLINSTGSGTIGWDEGPDVDFSSNLYDVHMEGLTRYGVYLQGSTSKLFGIGAFDFGARITNAFNSGLYNVVYVDRNGLIWDGANPLESSGTVTLANGTGSHTFRTPYASAPVCTATDSTAANPVSASATKSAIRIRGSGSDVVNWRCTPGAN